MFENNVDKDAYRHSNDFDIKDFKESGFVGSRARKTYTMGCLFRLCIDSQVRANAQKTELSRFHLTRNHIKRVRSQRRGYGS